MTENSKAKLSLQNIKGLRDRAVLWDTEVKGFGARGFGSGGGVSFILKKRINGRQRLITIGKLGSPWTPDTARKEALRIVSQGYQGVDESEEKRERKARGRLFGDAADEFMLQHGPKLKPRSREGYADVVRLYLKPRFEGKPFNEVTKGDIEKAHAAWSGKPRMANYALAVLSKLISWGNALQYRKDVVNPCRGIQKYAETKRERYLSGEESVRLGNVLKEAAALGIENPYVVAAIWLIVFTGARKREVMDLKWGYVDSTRRALNLPDSKTGKKTIALNKQALEILGKLKRIEGNPYVFPGKKEGKQLVNMSKTWGRIRKLAGIEDVRIHDLRHSFGFTAVDAGGSTKVLGRQLGHGDTKTTDLYAHVGDVALSTLVEATGDLLARRMGVEASRKPAGHFIRYRRRAAA
jgi:integrase